MVILYNFWKCLLHGRQKNTFSNLKHYSVLKRPMPVQGHTVKILVNQSSHTSFSNFLSITFALALNCSISGIRINPCFSPYSKALVFADTGPVAKKNGPLQCVISVANPHDSVLTNIA